MIHMRWHMVWEDGKRVCVLHVCNGNHGPSVVQSPHQPPQTSKKLDLYWGYWGSLEISVIRMSQSIPTLADLAWLNFLWGLPKICAILVWTYLQMGTGTWSGSILGLVHIPNETADCSDCSDCSSVKDVKLVSDTSLAIIRRIIAG